MSWKNLRISDCAVINPSSVNPTKLPYECINYYDISSVGSGVLGEISRINVADAPSRARRQIESGDTILAMVRPGNKTYYYFKTCDNQDIVSTGYAVLRPKRNVVDPRFLYYAVTNDAFIAYLVQHEKGATYPAVDESIILNGIIDTPDLETQYKISSVLSSFDDLIENNQKQIKLLEEAAQRLYKEWFVDLRFPGHEETPIVDGVPEGWTLGELGDIAIDSGKKEKKEHRGQYQYYLPIDCLPKRSLAYTDKNDITLAESSLVAFMPNDILFGAMRPYFHKVVVARDKGLTRTTCFVINSKTPAYWAYLLLLLFSKDTVDYATQISVGTTMPYVRWKDFTHMPTLIPLEEKCDAFQAIVLPIIERISCLAVSCERLIQARDRLLPKLISGEVEM